MGSYGSVHLSLLRSQLHQTSPKTKGRFVWRVLSWSHYTRDQSSSLYCILYVDFEHF
jgi:hypothetical protein